MRARALSNKLKYHSPIPEKSFYTWKNFPGFTDKNVRVLMTNSEFAYDVYFKGKMQYGFLESTVWVFFPN